MPKPFAKLRCGIVNLLQKLEFCLVSLAPGGEVMGAIATPIPKVAPKIFSF